MSHAPAPQQRPLHPGLQWSWKVVNVAFGMAGLRLDRWRNPGIFLPWAFCWLACWGGYYAAFEFEALAEPGPALKHLALAYALVVWVLYYVLFLSVALSSPLRLRLIGQFGEDRAYAAYEAMLGVVFVNQGLSQMAIMKAYEVTLPGAVPSWLLLAAGSAFVMTGFFWKAWATYLTGLDTYYYRDMFLGRSTAKHGTGDYVVTGPFKFVKNPMYGIGNLQAYGGAIWYGSWQGLLVAFLFQASIYTFYFLFERPFVLRIYCSQPAMLNEG